MISNHFSLGGSHGSYPIYDFKLEDNYDRTSQLDITTDADLVDSISNERFMQLYYLDNKLFEGIPVHGSEQNGDFSLTIFDKSAALWIAGGFAISNGSGEVNYIDMPVYNIVRDMLNGSQFLVDESTVPVANVSINASWQTKPDFLFNIAKQITDENGNICTVWVDDKNYVHIGAMNADKIIDLSDNIINISNKEMNFISFGGSVIKGGKDDSGSDILETSLTSKMYSDYHFNNKSLSNFIVSRWMADTFSTIKFEPYGNHTRIKLGFNKESSGQITSWWGDPWVNDIRKGNFYSNQIILRDKTNFYEYDKLDLSYKVWLDATSNTAIDNWLSTSLYSISMNSAYPKVSGPPYTYLKGISVGFMDDNFNSNVEFTLEKYAAGIHLYSSYAGSTKQYTISDIGQFRFYVNMGNYSSSIAFPDPSANSTTPYSPNPIVIPYYNNRNYGFNFRFKSRSDGWKLQCAMSSSGDYSSNPWYMITDACNQYVANMSDWSYNPKDWLLGGSETWVNGATGPQNAAPPVPTKDYLFSNTSGDADTFPDGTVANALTGGGYPYIRAYLQTNVEPSLRNDAWYISQITKGSNRVPFVVGRPKKSVQHTPYLFYSDASIKNKWQANALAKNVYRDYQKVTNADIDIDPMAYFYPKNSLNRFKIGWTVHLDHPKISGDYRIRSISATPSTVSISLKNRNLGLSDIIDKIQKQIKDVI